METFGNLFHLLLFQPILNGLVFLYTTLPVADFGIAILILTLITRVLLFPLTLKAARSQKALMALQPELKAVQQRYQKDQAKQAKAIMELYQKHKVNPISGCVPILLQLPILIALFRVFNLFRDQSGLSQAIAENLYSFIQKPDQINLIFAGIVNLGEKSLPLAIFAGLSQLVLSKLMTPSKKEKKPGGDLAQALSWQMTYFLPAMTVYFAYIFPAGLALYWAATTVFSIGQQWLVNKMTK